MRLYSRLVIFGMTLVFSGCTLWEASEKDSVSVLEITKWYGGRTFALSVNLDGGVLDFRTENEWLIAQGLFLDYELVTAAYDHQPHARQYLFDTLASHGFGYFGHGHDHVNHDAMGYQGALASFRLNHARMKAYGLTPVAYAYPEGMGLLDSTQQAVRDAGFYAARGFQEDPDGFGPHIMPGSAKAPRNWFHLPTLRMEDSTSTGCNWACTNDSREFLTRLEEAESMESWLISTYHAVGCDGQTDGRPLGWGYYKRNHFYADMTRVRELRDAGRLWLGRTDDVVRYTYQRQAAQTRILPKAENRFELHLSHDLDPAIFNHPLTLKLAWASAFSGRTVRITHPDHAEDVLQKTITPSLLIDLIPSSEPYTLEVL